MKGKKNGPCRNKGRLPKLTAYEKILFQTLDSKNQNRYQKIK